LFLSILSTMAPRGYAPGSYAIQKEPLVGSATMQVGSSLSRLRIGRIPTAKGLWMKWPFHSDLI